MSEPHQRLPLPRRSDRYAVVMAGGTGTRFWPQSRRRLPKQLLTVVGKRTLLQATVDRLRALVPLSQVLVVTHRDHAREVRRQLPRLARRNVLIEPVGRNTAPCVALAALEITRRVPEATFACLPADHSIADPAAFRATLAEAFAWAHREPCAVTIGIRPTRAETGYGYLRIGRRLGGRARRVSAFVEKPPLTRARRYVTSGRYLWNSGMFVWRTSTLLGLLDRHLPKVTAALRPVFRARGRARTSALVKAYARLTPVSIDHGVMEKAPHVLTVSGDFGWSDVGSWASLSGAAGGRATRQAPVVAVDSSGYVVVSSERLVALVGIKDLIVVDAHDALLVCRREQAQDVRRVVQELERRGLQKYL